MGPDLSTMYQNGAGSVASFYGGQQQGADQAQQAEKLRAMQLENAQSATMNPLNAQFRQGQVTQQAAELPGVVGQSQSLGAKGSEDMQLLAGKVATQFSNMSTQMSSNGAQQMTQDAEKLTQASQVMKQYPPAMQKEVLSKFVQQYGGNVNTPMFQGLMQAPDEMIQPATEALGRGMAMAGTKFIQDSATASAHGQVQKDVAAGNNKTSVDVATIAADSRVKAAETRATAMGDKVDVLQKLLKVPMANRDAEWNAQYESAMSSLTTLKAATGGDLAAAMIGGGKPMTTSERTSDTVHKVTTMNNGAPTAAPASKSDFENMAKQTWPNDDPSKYVYSINPDTGRIRRMPK